MTNNANHLHNRLQEHHLLITITFKYTCGSLVHPPWWCALHLNPLAYLHTLLEPSISLQLTFFIQDSKNLILYSQQRSKNTKYTCGSPVLPCPGCFHSSSASPKVSEMEPLDKAVYCKLQVSILISPSIKPYMSYVNRWIRQCTANSK